MSEGIEPATATISPPAERAAIARAEWGRTDPIRRTTAPRTTNGRHWEVELSAVPSREWLEFFKKAGAASATSAPSSLQPGRVTFDRASIVFKSDEHHVEAWIESLDTWIAAAGARYLMSLDEADRERSVRLEAEARQRERIQQLNERFKDL